MKTEDTSSLTRLMLGHTIRALRKDAGYSQSQFAEMIGVNRSYMNQIESGKMNASVSILVKIADGLDVPISALFAGMDECPPRKLRADRLYAAVKVPESRR